MTLKRTLILGACLVALLATTAFAEHAPGSHHSLDKHRGDHGDAASHHTEMLAKALALNESQKGTLKELFEELRAELKPVHEEFLRLVAENRADLADGNADAKVVGERTIAIEKLKRQMRDAHNELLEKLMPVLDADQKQKIEKMIEQHRSMGRDYDMPGF